MKQIESLPEGASLLKQRFMNGNIYGVKPHVAAEPHEVRWFPTQRKAHTAWQLMRLAAKQLEQAKLLAERQAQAS